MNTGNEVLTADIAEIALPLGDGSLLYFQLVLLVVYRVDVVQQKCDNAGTLANGFSAYGKKGSCHASNMSIPLPVGPVRHPFL